MQIELHKPKKRTALSALMRCWLPAMAAALVLWNCLAASPPVATNHHRLPIETFWAGSRCGCASRKPLVRWITDRDQLAAAVAAAKSIALTARVARQPVDWKRNGVVWIDMGLKLSGGYALSLDAPAANVSSGVADITVRWRQPRPGSVVTQQLTSPCLLLLLPRDNFRTIQINDEAGRMRARVELGDK